MHWFEEWHGAKLPSGCVSGLSTSGGAGSTAMSTGVTNALSSKASLGHGHPQSDITNLTAALSTKASLGHVHPTSEVTNLDSTLSGLAAQVSTKAAGSHTHAQSEVTGLTGALSSKTDLGHVHALADVTGLTSTLSGLASQISTKAAGSHTHPQADVSSLASDLAGKAASVHTHVMANITDLRTGMPSTWATASTHSLTGSTTMQAAAGLSFSVSSAAIYRFEFICGWQTISSATGIQLGVNGPASPLLVVYETDLSTGLGGVLTRTDRAFNVQTSPIAAVDAANVNCYGYLGGVLRTGASAGTLQLQYASEVAGSTVSIRAGSVGFLFGPL